MKRYRGVIRRSKFEDKVEAFLGSREVEYLYEPRRFEVKKAVYKGICSDCGSKKVQRKSTYKPDFYLIGSDIWIEAKGKLTVANRTAYKQFKEQYPEIDLRFLFMKNNPIVKGSRTTYMMWAIMLGFPAVVNKDGEVPDEWLQ